MIAKYSSDTASEKHGGSGEQVVELPTTLVKMHPD